MWNPFRRTLQITRDSGEPTHAESKAFPYLMAVHLSSPKYMEMAHILLNGVGEHIFVAGKSVRALNRFAWRYGLRKHPRLERLTITGPDGLIENYRTDEHR